MIKIVFVTQNDPFYVKHFFSEFLREYPKNTVTVMGVIIQNTFNQKNQLEVIKKALSFYGFYGFIKIGITGIGIKIASVLERFFKIQFDATIDSICALHNISVLQYKSVNSREFHDFIKDNNIDVIVSVAASEIFKSKILHLPRLGCINLHSSQLPKRRGMMPNFWTMYDCEQYAWITIHKMVEKLDDGPIILQDKFEILKEESFDHLAKRSKRFGAHLIILFMKLLEKGNVTYQPNDSSLATYHTFPTREDVKQFKRRGGRII